MKKHLFKRIICTLAAVMLMIGCGVSAYALHNYASSYIIDVDIDDAPEDAAYIDILVPVMKIENYEEFHDTKITDEKNAGIRIDQNSEIANYIDDEGFISLSLHTDCIKENDTYKYVYNCEISISGSIILRKDDEKHDANWLKDQYGEFKIAFVDKNGKVISVTETAGDEIIADQQHPSLYRSVKKALTFYAHKHVSAVTALIYLGIFLISVILIICIIVMFIKGIVQGIKASKE